MSEPTLYRFLDASGTLLYIGRTTDLPRRIWEHNREKLMHEVVTISPEFYADNDALRVAEDRAIREEKPLWNVVQQERQPLGKKAQFRIPPELEAWLWEERRLWESVRPAPEDGRRTRQWYVQDVVFEALRRLAAVPDVVDRMPKEGE